MAIDRRWLIGGGIVVLAGGAYVLFKRHRANQASAASTSNGAAYGGPLPGSGILGPIYSPINITTNPPGSPPASPPPAKAGGLTRIGTPAQTKQLLSEGFDVITQGNTQYYDPLQERAGGQGGRALLWIPTPQRSAALAKQGYTIYTIGAGQYYWPSQKAKAKA